jgi:3-oxoacyl-[acyl-carrier protein] reductase
VPQGSVEGRVALVTGSTRGIGRAVAELLGAEGARVVVHGRRQEDAERVAAGIPRAVPVSGNVGHLAEVRAICRTATNLLGPVDVLVNNAGIAPRTAITRVTDEEWDETIAVDLSAPFWFIRELVPAMKRTGGGCIVNVTSGAGIEGIAGFSSYAAAKGGIVGLSRTLALELAMFGIRVNLLSPGADTDMLRQLPPELLSTVLDMVPPLEDTARAVLELVADPHVTGRLVRTDEATYTRPAPNDA